MAYTPGFFAFQLRFAHRLAARMHMPFADALLVYTTLSKTLDGNWQRYVAGLARASDEIEWTFRWYQTHRSPDPQPGDASFLGHPLFGCWYYLVRNESTVRVHFVKNDAPHMRALNHERVAARRAELRRMFAHIQHHVPHARTVLGNSWLYNLVAYRRLFPPPYTATLPQSDDAEFQFLAWWGQCFDHAWNPKPMIAEQVLVRLETITRLEDLRWCFPYQILQPRCPIAEFYTFYGVEA